MPKRLCWAKAAARGTGIAAVTIVVRRLAGDPADGAVILCGGLYDLLGLTCGSSLLLSPPLDEDEEAVVAVWIIILHTCVKALLSLLMHLVVTAQAEAAVAHILIEHLITGDIVELSQRVVVGPREDVELDTVPQCLLTERSELL